MNNTEQAVIAVLVYYDLLDKPLTAVEIFKSLPPLGGVSFFELTKILANSVRLKKICDQKNGLYFLAGRGNLLKTREKRIKISQLKWRLLKKQAKLLPLIPFLRLAAVNGSLAIYNANQNSDFDLLIIAARDRLWLARVFTTIFTEILGVRRHKSLIKDRLCLNCYIDERDLDVETEARLYRFQSVQEYSRLTPIAELGKDLHKKFLSQNQWLGNYLCSFPWPDGNIHKNVNPPVLCSATRKIMEYPLSGAFGDWVGKKLGRYQMDRINKKLKKEPDSACFIGKNCLMFHPRSKSLKLLREFNQKITQIEKA